MAKVGAAKCCYSSGVGTQLVYMILSCLSLSRLSLS